MSAIDIKPHADFSAAWKSLLDELRDVYGDIAEFGVYNGGSTRVLARLWPHLTVWAFDTYSGMPREAFTEGLDHDTPGSFKTGYTFQEMFGDFPNIIPVRGLFEWALVALPLTPKIRFAYIDCDLFQSATTALWWLIDRQHLSPGGIIFLDDYATHRGIQAAVAGILDAHSNLQFDGKHIIRLLP